MTDKATDVTQADMDPATPEQIATAKKIAAKMGADYEGNWDVISAIAEALQESAAHSGEGRSNGAGEPLASIVVKLSAIRTVLREAHWALDDSEDMSHQDPPVHAVPLDNVMRLHRALKACERFASTDEAWDGPGPLVTKIIEWLGAALSAPQGEVERLREALDGVDCISRLRDELGGKIELTWLEPKQSWPLFNLLSEVNSGLAALAQPEAGGER